ncbi:glutaredoxin 3 [Rhabdaerophilum sp.]|uniref:glutaredoxin 3 n=1 Tax=Rhabdaerophilum sp. TaxID=2717341 RepID=UPI0038D463F6
MTGQHTTNPMTLPDNLPRPEDDGGAAHLTGMRMPSLSLPSTSSELVDLSALNGRVVVYAYPMTGMPGVELPPGWNDIPGARGCTPQTLSFQSEKDVFSGLGVSIFGLSTQTPAYQQELADRLALSFPILSDADFRITEALRLPTMTVEGMRLIKRLTLVIDNGVITHVFYPVFPPNASASQTIAWLRQHPMAGTYDPGVTIYTTPDCPYCKRAKALLGSKGIMFTEIDVSQDGSAAETMAARSGRTTVPQIFIGATHVGGSDELLDFAKSGRLDAVLSC